ncbi:hypothetical protein CF327_g633 [Tilletia walkeri]|nr:hypothetical protein CF327_g633 [Tilletia walkeri]
MTAVLPPPIHSIAAAPTAAARASHTMMGLPQDYNFAFVAKVPRPSIGAPHARIGSFSMATQQQQQQQQLQDFASSAANAYAYDNRSSQHHSIGTHHSLVRTPRRGSYLDGATFAPLVPQASSESSSAQGRANMQHSVHASQDQRQSQREAQASAYFTSSQVLERDYHDARHAPLLSPTQSSKQQQQQQMWHAHAHAHAAQDGVVPQTPPEQSHAKGVAHSTPASATKSHSRPSTERIANFFASMTCYIWFATGLPDTSPLNTPLHSPSTTHAPLFPTPLAASRRRSHRELHAQTVSTSTAASSAHTGVAGPLSILPTDDFADRLSLAMERVTMATGMEGAAAHGLHARPLGSLRMQPSARFVAFIKNLLTTTQVSSSVILLALLYIYRLKSRHPQLNGQEGSEYRLSVTSLMLANKWLDDHTYLNKTWSELSGIELCDVTKMEREFWSGLGMDISASAGDFQYWLKQVENMTLRREAKIQGRIWDIRARRIQQRRARELARAGSSSPSRRLPGRFIGYGAKGGETDEVNPLYAPQNSPVHALQPGVGHEGPLQPAAYPYRQPNASRTSPAVGEAQDGFGEMIGSRRLPPPVPSPLDATFRDPSVPRRLFDSRPSSASSGGSFVAMHQSFKGLSTNSPASLGARLGAHQREHDVSPHRSNKRFAADPDWADNPFTFNASSQQLQPPQPSMHLALPSGRYSPNGVTAMSRYRGPRSVPAHEVHQNLHPYSGHYGNGYDGHRNGRSDDYESYAQALVAPFTGYDAALTSSHERDPATLAYYEVRSGPYRSMQNTGEPAPFMTQHGQDGWETLRQAAQYFAPTTATGYAHVSPDNQWENGYRGTVEGGSAYTGAESGPVDAYGQTTQMYGAAYEGPSAQSGYPNATLQVPPQTASHQNQSCASDAQTNADFQAAVQDAYAHAHAQNAYPAYAQQSHHQPSMPMRSQHQYQQLSGGAGPGSYDAFEFHGGTSRDRTESYPHQHHYQGHQQQQQQQQQQAWPLTQLDSNTP